jgi:RimJ/RimL family protein N-acetyltransferase
MVRHRDRELTNWVHTPTREECAHRMEEVLAFYGKEPLHFGPYTIRDEDGRFLGLIGADLADPVWCAYDIWYVLRRDTWGRGIGTRAVGDLLAQMADSGRVKKATATVVADNAASRRLLARHGFTQQALVAGGHQRHGLSLDLLSYSRDFDAKSPSVILDHA